VDQLVGAAEIAERLGVGKSTVVHDWRRRHPEFPQPVAQLKTALVWDWAEIAKWARDTGRVPMTVVTVTSRRNGDKWTLSIDDMANTLDVDVDSAEVARQFVADVLDRDPESLDVRLTRYPT